MPVTVPRHRRRHSHTNTGAHRLSRIPVSVLQGPFEFCTAALSAVLGLGVFATSLIPGADFTTIQGELPLWLVLVWSFFLLVGGVGVVLGILRREAQKVGSLTMEAASLVIMSTGWVVYGLAPLFTSGRLAVIPITLFILVASLLRGRAIALAVRITRETQGILSENR